MFKSNHEGANLDGSAVSDGDLEDKRAEERLYMRQIIAKGFGFAAKRELVQAAIALTLTTVFIMLGVSPLGMFWTCFATYVGVKAFDSARHFLADKSFKQAQKEGYINNDGTDLIVEDHAVPIAKLNNEFAIIAGQKAQNSWEDYLKSAIEFPYTFIPFSNQSKFFQAGRHMELLRQMKAFTDEIMQGIDNNDGSEPSSPKIPTLNS